MATENTSFIDILNAIHRADSRELSKFLKACYRKCDDASVPEPEEEVQRNASERLLARLDEDGGEEYSVLYWELYEEAVTLLARLRAAPRREEPRGHSAKPPRNAPTARREERPSGPPARSEDDFHKKFGFAHLIAREIDFALPIVVPEVERRLLRINVVLPDATTFPFRITALKETFEDSGDWETGWKAGDTITRVYDDLDLSDRDKREVERKKHTEAEAERKRAEEERKRQEEAARKAEAEAERRAQQEARGGEVEARKQRALAAAKATAEPPKPRDSQRGSSVGNGIKGMKMCPYCAAGCLETVKFCPECGTSFVAAPPPPPAPAPAEPATPAEVPPAEPEAPVAKDEEEADAPAEPATPAEVPPAEPEAPVVEVPNGKPVQGKGEPRKQYLKRLAAWAEKQ